MNQLKDDAEQFRKLKSEMAKEVLQLKSQVVNVCLQGCAYVYNHSFGEIIVFFYPSQIYVSCRLHLL